MQYKGVKRIKRVAAVILSAALLLTELPQAGTAYAAQAQDYKVSTDETEMSTEQGEELEGKEDGGAESDAAGAEAPDIEASESSNTESSNTETSDTETSDTEMSGTETPHTETTETESAENRVTEPESAPDTETTESGEDGTETGTETTEIETETENDTETTEIETIETESGGQLVSAPEVDTGVYEYESGKLAVGNAEITAVQSKALLSLAEDANGEYVINNKDEFLEFIGSASDYSGKTVRLNSNINLSGMTVSFPVEFRGTFDGNGYSIENFKTDVGLFRTIGSSGTIQNLHISRASLDTTTKETAAGIVAGTNNGTIKNVTVTGTLEATTAMSYSAGIAAVNKSGARIENCVFAGTLIAQTGITGTRIQGGIAAQNEGTVTACYTYGTMTSAVQACAGIAAENDGTVSRCRNYMNITSSYNAAGIVANNRYGITDCANYGNIVQNDNSVEAAQIGGIVSSNTISGNVSGCYNFAEVKSEKSNAGGIAGLNAGNISASGNRGTVSGNGNVGGVIGQSRITNESNVISNCFNTGNVSGTGESAGTGIGGIVGASGSNYTVNLEGCYNRGNISGTDNMDGIGGIIGIADKGNIKKCYNAGVIAEAPDKCVGNIAGLLTAEVTAADYYYLKNENVTADYYKKDGITAVAVTEAEQAKTEEELKSLASGLGFVADSGNNNAGYPVIDGQGGNEKQYLIVYEVGGGQSDWYYEIVTEGGNVSKPQDPTKINAAFEGWFTSESFTDAFRFEAVISGAAVIYAGWNEKIQATDFTFPQTEVTLVKGETFPIVVKYTPEDAQNKDLIWTSSDTGIATVDEEGVVTAVAEVEDGNQKEAVITARMKDGTLSKECSFRVIVTGKSNIVRIMTTEEPVIEIKDLDVAMNYPVTVEAVVGGTTTGTISWHTLDEKIAKVEAVSGNSKTLGKITGVSPGRTTITAILDNGNDTIISARLDVMVCDKAEQVVIMLDEDPVTEKKVFYDLVTQKFVAIGTEAGNKLEEPVENLSAKVLPSGAIQKVEWKSSDTSVIKFEDKNSGVVTPNSNGTATITVSATDGTMVSGKTEVESLKVVQSLALEPKEISSAAPVIKDERGKIVLTAGGKIKLMPVYNPSDATYKNVAWSISHLGALSIDPDTFEVTAGDVTNDTTVTVTARSLDLGPKGDGAQCTVEFIIKPKVSEIEIYRAEDMKNPVNNKNIGVNPENDSERIINLTVKNKPENASQIVVWKSSNEDLAKITDNGDESCRIEVARNKVGTSIITATAADGSGVSARTTINVTEKVSRIIIKGSKSVVKGGSITLTAEVEPKSVTDKTVTWRSLTPDTAVVDAKTGKVTGKDVGLAIIMATANDGSNTTEEFGIRVTEPIKTFYIIKDGTEGQTVNGEYIIDEKDSLNNKSVGVDPDTGKVTYKLDTYIYPETACQTVTWKSGNENIATVGEDGTITAVGLGTATITATTDDGSNKKVSVKVNVTTLSRSVAITGSHFVGAGKTIQLTAEVGDKDAANKNVVWSSSDSEVIKVDSKGKISTANGKTAGFSIIRAEAADGSGEYAEHKVYIMGEKDTVAISNYDSRFPIQNDNNQAKYIEFDMKDKETEEIRLTADLTGGTSYGDEDKLVVWSSSNSKVATVTSEIKNGKSVATVTVYMEGTAVITAKTADGYASKDTCTLKVENSNPVVRITGPKQAAKGKKIQLSAGATVIGQWTSSDTSVATVNTKGQVTAKGVGTAIIKAEAKVGTNSGTYEITVKEAVKKVDIVVNNADGTQSLVTGQKLGMDIINGYDGSSGDSGLHLSAIVDGDDNTAVTWKSSKAAVAKVDENGTVEVLKTGTATITATATDGSGKKATVSITVAKQVTKIEAINAELSTDDSGAYEVNVAYKKSVQLSLSYRPLAATTKKVTWAVASEDKSYISVSSSGKVTAKNYLPSDKPYATVIATASDNGGQTCVFHICITKPADKVVLSESDTPDLVVSTLGLDIDGSGKIKLAATVTDKDKNLLQNQRIVWKSSNTKIASVDDNGEVTGLKEGKAVITGTVQDGTKKSGKITIYVGKIVTAIEMDDTLIEGVTLRKGKSLDLMQLITVLPVTATNKNLTFKTSNKNVVTVNSKGKITSKGVYKSKGVTYDTAVISILTNDGSNIEVNIEVKVTN